VQATFHSTTKGAWSRVRSLQDLPALTFARLRYVLAWLCLGEELTLERVVGLLLAGRGTLMVNLRGRQSQG
jgi:uncharacterized membrane protein